MLMKTDLYFDTFTEYEKNIEIVKDIIKIDSPSWQHLWLYRYLQISPSYYLTHLLINSKTPECKKHYDFMMGYQDVTEWNSTIQLAITAEIYKDIGDVWGIDFIRWWYTRGRYLFIYKEPNINPPIKEIFHMRRGRTTDHFDFYLNEFKKHYEAVMSNPNYPDFVTLFVPIRSTLKETMVLVRNHFKQWHIHPGDLRNNAKFSIAKSKLRESTLRDCFKVYELWVKQEKTDLASIGIQANVLRSAMADYKFSNEKLAQMSSLDSLRSGTSRQINNAIYLSENAALGLIPSINKTPIIFKFKKDHLASIFKHLTILQKRKSNQKDALIKFANKEKNIVRKYSSYSKREAEPLDILIGQEIVIKHSKLAPRRSSSSRR